jgi:hypothetical protein
MRLKFDRIDLWTMRAFLTRVVPRGPQEEDELISLVEKIDRHLEGNTHVNTGQTGSGAEATSSAL